MELVGILVAFVGLMVMISRRVPLYIAMLAASLVVLVSAGVGPMGIARVVGEAVTHRDTMDLMLIVASITIMSHVLQKHGYFDKMVQALRVLLKSDALTLMFIPGLVGCMPMTGGAIVSAPMVWGLGKRIQLSPERQSAANLIFRHSWYFVFPFLPTYIMAARLVDVEIYEMIGMLWPLTLVMMVAGYFFILRPGLVKGLPKREDSETERPRIGAALYTFLRYGFPLILGLALYMGFRVHLALSLMIGLAVALFQILFMNGPERPSLSVIPRLFWDGIDFALVGTMAAIMVFRGAVNETTAFGQMVEAMMGAGIPLYLVAGGLAVIIGYISASHASTIAVLFPLIIPAAAAAGANHLTYIMIIYAFAFLSYLMSPLHLCQILTNHYFEVSLGKVYRIYLPVIAVVAVTTAILATIRGF